MTRHGGSARGAKQGRRADLRSSVWFFDELFQELVNLIELRLKLCEARELNVELLAQLVQISADLGELIFNEREDVFSTRRRACRPALAPCPGRAALTPCTVFASFTALAALTLCAARPCCFGCHCAKFYAIAGRVFYMCFKPRGSVDRERA